jgi:hypothetical protein
MDLENYTDDDLKSELYPSIIHFSQECSNILVDFRNTLLGYFYKSIDYKSFLILDSAIISIININCGIKYIDFEVFRNIHNQLQNSKDDFNQAIKAMNSIENEYHKLKRKLIKTKI